jgi:hypothetical protein
MQMFSINRLAEMFERDRSTIVRALRGVPRDGGSADRPQYTVATTNRALQDHFAAKSSKSDVDPTLQAQFDELEAQHDAIQNAPTLAERRKLARSFFRFLAEVESAMRADGKRSGEDARLTGLRCAEHTRLYVTTSRHALGWNFDEAWREFMKADPRMREDV